METRNIRVQQRSTGHFYVLRLEWQWKSEGTWIDATRSVLEAYGPLSQELVTSDDRLDQWNYPQELRVDVVWVILRLFTADALPPDFIWFPCPRPRKPWFNRGWDAGRKYGQHSPDVSAETLCEEVGEQAERATLHLSDKTWEDCYDDYVSGFINGFKFQTGRYIE